VNCLDVLCAFGEHLDTLLQWNRDKRAVTIGVESEQKINFLRVEKKVLESSRVVCISFELSHSLSHTSRSKRRTACLGVLVPKAPSMSSSRKNTSGSIK
jgi:hypothetical protein